MRDTGLADRLRAKGLKVVEMAGWTTRGGDDLDVRCSVNHHTASSRRGGNAPALGIVTNGRSGAYPVAGPLCNVLKARDQTCYVVAAGRSNNAGLGGWRGVTGNRHTLGLECENTGLGDEPWSEADIDTMARVHAAFMETHFSDVRMVCQHFEWAPSRKIDAYRLDPNAFRARVQSYYNRSGPGPIVITKPPPLKDEFMAALTEKEQKDLKAQVASVNWNVAVLLNHVKDVDGKGPYLPRFRENLTDNSVEVARLRADVDDVQARLARIESETTEILGLLRGLKDSVTP